MTSTPEDEGTAPAVPAMSADVVAVLLDARDLALSALQEITPASSVGEPADYRVEGENVLSLRFHNRLAGYPGWFWTVTLAKVDDSEPTVLEVELLPGTGALVAPDWVPWAVRLAEYHAAQEALAESESDDDAEGLDDVDDLDASDFDEDGSPILHAGDVDGVDIDELDESDDDDSDDDDESDDDDSDDDDESDDDDSDDDDSDDDESDEE